MEIEIPYRNHHHPLAIDDKAEVAILQPAPPSCLGSLYQALEEALDHPLGSPAFDELLRRKAPRSVALALPDDVSADILAVVIPGLLARIRRRLPRLRTSDIRIVVGNGPYPPFSQEEIEAIIPAAIADGCPRISHDACNSPTVDFGVTRRGTPVRVNADFAAADLKIVIGLIYPHQFVGFTGGAKCAVYACGAAETIEHHHRLMSAPAARVGALAGNPAREDLDEAGRLVGIDLAVNIVPTPDRQPVQLLAGEPASVLRAGADICAVIYGVVVRERFDIVVISCSWRPHEDGCYQLHKGLLVAAPVVREGGKILILAACNQGVGDDIYFDYVCTSATPALFLAEIKRAEASMGAQRAFRQGRVISGAGPGLDPTFESGVFRNCQLRAADPSTVISEWVNEFQGRPRVAVIPNANNTYCYVQE